MARLAKRLLLLLLVAAMVVSAFACGGSKKPAGGEEGKTTEEELDKGLDLYNEKWKGKTITITINPGDEELSKQWADGTFDLQVQRGFVKEYRKEFEDATGCTIINRPTPAGEDMTQRIITEISAGMGPDIFLNWTSAKPSFMVKNLIVPLSDYIDFNKPVYQDEKYISHQVRDYFSFAGKIWGINKPMPSCVLWYNKEKFEELGLEDPLELWKRGQWNWDKFWEVGTALTQDKNGDGNPDQWAYCTWKYNDSFIYSNGVEYVTYDELGLPRFALDEKYITARQAAEDAINKYKIVPSVWWDPPPQSRFENGEVCMHYWLTNQVRDAKRVMGAEKVGIVPFPRGPDLPPNVKSRDQAETLAFFVSSTCKDPDLAALYLEWVMLDEEGWRIRKERLINDFYGSEELYNLGMEWAANAVQLDYSGFGQGFVDAINKILNKPDDQTWMQAIEANRAACQQALNDAIIEMK